MRQRRVGVFVAYCDLLLVIVSLLIVSVAPKKVADGVKVKAEYLVTIEWDSMLDADIDLWAIGPPDPSKPCSYMNVESGALSLDRDSRGYMDDRILVDNHLMYMPHKETMSLRGIVPGRYTYAIFAYKVRPSDDGSKPDPRALGIVVHVEAIRINPKVTVIFRKDYRLEYEDDAINVFAMDVLPDGNFVEAELPVEPITKRFYLGKAP